MVLVIDSHCHIFPETFSQNRVELSRRDATFAELFSGKGTGEITGAKLRSTHSAPFMRPVATF